MVRASSTCFEKITQLRLKMPDYPCDFVAPSVALATAGQAPTKQAAASLAPKIIRYVNGKSITTQDVVGNPFCTEWGEVCRNL